MGRKTLGELVTPLAKKICPRLYRRWDEASSKSEACDKIMEETRALMKSEVWKTGSLPKEIYEETEQKLELVGKLSHAVTGTLLDVLGAVVPHLLKENRKLKRELAELKTTLEREAKNAG